MDKNSLRTGIDDPTGHYGGAYQPNLKKWKMATVLKHVDGLESVAWDGGVWLVQPFSINSVPEGAADHYFRGNPNYSVITPEEAEVFIRKSVELLHLSKQKKDMGVRKTPYELFMADKAVKMTSVDYEKNKTEKEKKVVKKK